MVKSMRLRNLRSFPNEENIDFIDLKPITVLVGKNSSGKSSFIRTLPLLRQSVEAKTTGPILWYGSYVDFGAYSEVIKNNSKEDVIFFDFKIDLTSISRRQIHSYGYFYNYEFFGKDESIIPTCVELGVSHFKNETYAKRLKIEIEGLEFNLEFEEKEKCSLIIKDDETLSFDKLSYSKNNYFIPRLGSIEKFERVVQGSNVKYMKFNDLYLHSVITNSYMDKLRPFFHRNTQDETIINGIRKIGICRRAEVENQLHFAFPENKVFKEKLKNEKSKKIICELFFKASLYSSLNEIIERINLELESSFKSIRYIAPLRATAERYYRHQDLQVDEIDHTGSNLAMLLKSLPDHEKRNFSSWTLDHFGFSVRADEQGLHYAIMIKTENDSKEYNINDMGFGFSQILPIVASIWVEIYRKKHVKNSNKHMIFAIEQPELHLHPEYQARLAILFAKVISFASKNDINIKIIFETHSKTMIDALGDCVEDKIIPHEDINIVVFNKDSNNDTRAKFSNFSEDGFLVSWPTGFFAGR
ncbi:MAG: AAA family ATPase [Aeromonas hydrophila]